MSAEFYNLTCLHEDGVKQYNTGELICSECDQEVFFISSAQVEQIESGGNKKLLKKLAMWVDTADLDPNSPSWVKLTKQKKSLLKAALKALGMETPKKGQIIDWKQKV